MSNIVQSSVGIIYPYLSIVTKHGYINGCRSPILYKWLQPHLYVNTTNKTFHVVYYTNTKSSLLRFIRTMVKYVTVVTACFNVMKEQYRKLLELTYKIQMCSTSTLLIILQNVYCFALSLEMQWNLYFIRPHRKLRRESSGAYCTQKFIPKNMFHVF